MNINKKPGAGRHRVDSAIQGNLKTASYCGDTRLEFLGAIRAAGIAIAEPEAIVADGEIHRFHIEGDRHGTRNGWSVLSAGTQGAGGAFGNWQRIPVHAGHRFRSMPAGDSGPCRPPIPVDAGRGK